MNTLSPKSAHPIFKIIEQCKNIATLKQVHAQMITTGLIFHTYPLSRILISSSTIDATISYALSIFNHVTNPTIFLFNTLISSSLSRKKDDQTHFALALYNRILTQTTLIPNSYTYPSLFKACGSQPWIQHGRALHTHVLKFLEPPYDHFVQASLLNFYSKCGELGVARFLFDQITGPDLASWNSILAAYAHNYSVYYEADLDSVYDSSSLSLEVLLLFSQMQKSLTCPNEVSLVALISACADLGALSHGIWAHSYVLRNDLKLNRFVGTALIAVYSNCGRLDFARQVFDQLLERDTYCYNAMIRGLAVHGLGVEALELFKKMDLEGLVPDDVTMLVIMCACSNVGLVDQGCKFFESMKEDYGIEPKLEHYGTLVDLFGRAGRVKEAEEIVQTIPMKPNAVLWRSLLGAARVHGNLEVGESALKQLIQLEPETSGNYVLLSNMYASLNRWDDVKQLRKLMKDQGIEKAPGSSIVDIDGAMHEFLIGDKTHPELKWIYVKLDEMHRRLQEHGHKSGTREVLFDIEEEEKESALTYHSERLAIAYALIASDSGAPIRIIKNLRVCNDCHTATKLISRIYEREIIVRDRSRFHHFKNGTCSCLDYW
ncbi:pentatricopeptide repeat-containing protein At5g43790 [Solanum lycopersicum]|uniref:DYW domain-containing protein n=1 Tax=Solanum lycopersicum TaxID=4081 RepID=A0A3Q7IFQ3_SOLLC|nr:pentatricopeptide repeat-containing protein At5g43790 [Solanum lycopersicum]